MQGAINVHRIREVTAEGRIITISMNDGSKDIKLRYPSLEQQQASYDMNRTYHPSEGATLWVNEIKQVMHATQNNNTLVKMLKTVAERECALEKLALRTRNYKHATEIAKVGGIYELVPLLTNQNLEVQATAAEALANLALALLTSPNELLQATAAMVLANLAQNHENSKAIQTATVIPLLVKLLNSPNVKVQATAAKALANLAQNHENNEAIQTANVIPLLVELLNSPNEQVQENAAGALWNLAQNHENRVAINKADGIRPLVKMLESTNAVVQKNAIGALANLSYDNHDNTVEITQLGGIDRLIKLSSNSLSASANKYAGLALVNCHKSLNLDKKELKSSAVPFEQGESDDDGCDRRTQNPSGDCRG